MARRTHLADGYVDEYGETANCWSIAREFYAALGNEGQNARLLRLQSEGTTRGTTYLSEMTPVPYPDKIWCHHYVCAVDELVYDPILETPTDYEDYPKLAFNIGVLAVIEEKLWAPGLAY